MNRATKTLDVKTPEPHSAVAGVRILVAILALTSLVAELAEKYGLTVIALERPDRMLVFSDPHGALD